MFILSWSSVADAGSKLLVTHLSNHLMSRPQSVVKIVLLCIFTDYFLTYCFSDIVLSMVDLFLGRQGILYIGFIYYTSCTFYFFNN